MFLSNKQQQTISVFLYRKPQAIHIVESTNKKARTSGAHASGPAFSDGESSSASANGALDTSSWALPILAEPVADMWAVAGEPSRAVFLLELGRSPVGSVVLFSKSQQNTFVWVDSLLKE